MSPQEIGWEALHLAAALALLLAAVYARRASRPRPEPYLALIVWDRRLYVLRVPCDWSAASEAEARAVVENAREQFRRGALLIHLPPGARLDALDGGQEQ